MDTALPQKFPFILVRNLAGNFILVFYFIFYNFLELNFIWVRNLLKTLGKMTIDLMQVMYQMKH